MFFRTKGAFDWLKSMSKQKKSQKLPTTAKSIGSAIHSIAKSYTNKKSEDLKINKTTPTKSKSRSSTLFKLAKSVTNSPITKKKKPTKPTSQKVAKKTSGSNINPGSATINI
tara:strand:+ start:402 stop:737 length:336 start_codon:yes stop_codon:yes gene_type:complete